MGRLLPYILPLLLGRTFDLDKMQVGVDIFPKDAIDRKVIIQNPVTETHYKIVDNTAEARNLLDVGGSFSLNVKAGLFKAGASGEYLADTYNRENTVEVAVKASYQTVTEQLPADAKPLAAWKTLGNILGTHFVRSITYGGELIASVRFECNNTKEKQKIKGALEVGGRIELFDLGVEVEGEHTKDVSKSIESTQIKVFSSIPISKLPNDMESLKKTLDAFPDDLKLFNEGRGIPLKIELWPLKLLDLSKPDHLQNKLLEASLESFEEKFDDLLNTKSAIADWMKIMVKPITEEQETKIGELYGIVENTLKEFYRVIGSLDMSKDVKQLGKADEAYGSGIPGSFYRKYLLLRQEIVKDQGDWKRSKSNGVTYIHWGKSNCSGVAEQLYEGKALGPAGFGSGANFLCLPEAGNSPDDQEDAALVRGISFVYPGHSHVQVSCSACCLGTRASVQVFPGRSTCPEDWGYIYDGLLMSGSKDTSSTMFVCLDKTAKESANTRSENLIVPNWLLYGKDQMRMLFSCVVCSK